MPGSQLWPGDNRAGAASVADGIAVLILGPGAGGSLFLLAPARPATVGPWLYVRALGIRFELRLS